MEETGNGFITGFYFTSLPHEPLIGGVAYNKCGCGTPFAVYLTENLNSCVNNPVSRHVMMIQDLRNGAVQTYDIDRQAHYLVDFCFQYRIVSFSNAVKIVTDPSTKDGHDYIVILPLPNKFPNNTISNYTQTTGVLSPYELHYMKIRYTPSGPFVVQGPIPIPHHLVTDPRHRGENGGVLISGAIDSYTDASGVTYIYAAGFKHGCLSDERPNLADLGTEADKLYVFKINQQGQVISLARQTLPAYMDVARINISAQCDKISLHNASEQCPAYISPHVDEFFSALGSSLSGPNGYLLPSAMHRMFYGDAAVFSRSGRYILRGTWETNEVELYDVSNTPTLTSSRQIPDYSIGMPQVYHAQMQRMPSGTVLALSHEKNLISFGDLDNNTVLNTSLIFQAGNNSNRQKLFLPNIEHVNCDSTRPYCKRCDGPTTTTAPPTATVTPGSPRPSPSPTPSFDPEPTGTLTPETPRPLMCPRILSMQSYPCQKNEKGEIEDSFVICLETNNETPLCENTRLRIWSTKIFPNNSRQNKLNISAQASVVYNSFTRCFSVKIPAVLRDPNFAYDYHIELLGNIFRFHTIKSDERFYTAPACGNGLDCEEIIDVTGLDCSAEQNFHQIKIQLTGNYKTSNCPENFAVVVQRAESAQGPWNDIYYPVGTWDAVNKIQTYNVSYPDVDKIYYYRAVLRPFGELDPASQIISDKIVSLKTCPSQDHDCPIEPSIIRHCPNPDDPQNSANHLELIVRFPAREANCTANNAQFRLTLNGVDAGGTTAYGWLPVIQHIGQDGVLRFRINNVPKSDRIQILLNYSYIKPNDSRRVVKDFYLHSLAPCEFDKCIGVHVTGMSWGTVTDLKKWESVPHDEPGILAHGFHNDIIKIKSSAGKTEFKNLTDILRALPRSIPDMAQSLDGIALPPNVRMEIFDGEGFDTVTSNKKIVDVTGPLLIANSPALDSQPGYRARYYSMKFTGKDDWLEDYYPANSAKRSESRRLIDEQLLSEPARYRSSLYDIFNWFNKSRFPKRSVRFTIVGAVPDRFVSGCPTPEPTCPCYTPTKGDKDKVCLSDCNLNQFVLHTSHGITDNNSIKTCAGFTISARCNCLLEKCVSDCLICYKVLFYGIDDDNTEKLVLIDDTIGTTHPEDGEFVEGINYCVRALLNRTGFKRFKAVIISHPCEKFDYNDPYKNILHPPRVTNIVNTNFKCIGLKDYLNVTPSHTSNTCRTRTFYVGPEECRNPNCEFLCFQVHVFRKFPGDRDYPGKPSFSLPVNSFTEFNSTQLVPYEKGELRRYVVEYFSECNFETNPPRPVNPKPISTQTFSDFHGPRCLNPFSWAQDYDPQKFNETNCHELIYQQAKSHNECDSCGYCAKYYLYSQSKNEEPKVLLVMRDVPSGLNLRNMGVDPTAKIWIQIRIFDKPCSEVKTDTAPAVVHDYTAMECAK